MNKTSKKNPIIQVIVAFLVAAVVVGGLIFGDIMASQNVKLITQYLCGFGIDDDTEEVIEARTKGIAMAQEIEEKGIVLLKNQDKVLPLKNNKVNVFGWNACDNGFLYQGGGSGSGSTYNQVSFYNGLAEAGVEYNKDLAKAYNDLNEFRHNRNEVIPDEIDAFKLYEAPESFYTQERIDQAKNYSDTAVVVIGRRGSEGFDAPMRQYDKDGRADDSRHYLELTPTEEMLLNIVKNNFGTVIVVLNTASTMELGFLEDEGIDAALSMGLPGNHAASAVGKILLGAITPSGKTVDTYAYDLTTAPTFVNIGTTGTMQWTDRTDRCYYIDYAENIYVGYRWYETADAEGYWNNVSNEFGKGYEGVVQYPFGFGLSYTEFEWDLLEVNVSDKSTLTAESEVTFKVRVTNDGDYPGADVVELYFSRPYYKGEIEKPSIELGDFKKTSVLQPKQYEELTLSVKMSDMASYDCYDSNNNGFIGYEADATTDDQKYTISLRTDVHTLKDMRTGSAEFTYDISDGGLKFERDADTGTVITNQFTTFTNRVTGASSKINEPFAKNPVSIDGYDTDAERNQGVKYMSRADFTATYPTRTPRRKLGRLNEDTWKVTSPFVDKSDVMPETESTKTNYTINDLASEPYDSPKWDDLISQLSVSEMMNLIGNGGMQTYRIKSIDKPSTFNFDGPSGINNKVTGQNDIKTTNYPCETVLAQTWDWKMAYKMGLAVGEEALAIGGVSGWFAPGANMHRSPFGGRNFEYYSEDDYISGIMAAYEIRGCMEKGLSAYMKHFVANDSDTGRNGEYRWLTEQSLREIYMEPFRIAVKVGKANAIMTSVDRVGSTRAAGSYALLTAVLRDEWGFEGSVETDYYQQRYTYDVHDADECIRAGNDQMLYQDGGSWMFDDQKTPTAIIAMQKSSKNILYTYIHTKYVAATETGLDLGSFIGEANDVFPWWIILVVLINVLAVGGCTVWCVFATRNFIMKRKK